MADIIPQWLRPSPSTTSTNEGIRGSHIIPTHAMSRPSENDWRHQQKPAAVGNIRGGLPSIQGRGGQQGAYWKVPGPSRVDIYAAVDSWRSYANHPNTLQSSISSEPQSKTSFDPFAQVFQSQRAGHQNTNRSQYLTQAPQQYLHENDGYPGQAQSRVQPFQVASGGTDVYYGVTSYQTGPGRRDQVVPATLSRLRPYETVRLSNTQERQQATQLPSGSWRDKAQPTFTQQVPIRPMRGVDRVRGYASSRNQPVQSIEQNYPLPERRPGTEHDDFRRTFPRQSTARRNDAPAVPPRAPVASQVYLAKAHLQPERRKGPQRLLVILDLNGTLMLKPDYRKPKAFHVRPGAPKLLEYLFANHTVMVYTSGQPHNAEIVARGLFSAAQYDKLAAIWARDKLDLTPTQYRAKVQVYKKINKIWANNEIQSSFSPPGTGKWDQTNTILVDDSHLKALQEPHNLLQVTEFIGEPNGLKKKAYTRREEQICQSLMVKLEELKWQKDVSRLIFRWQTGIAEIPTVPGSNFFVDEKVDQKEQAIKDLEAAMYLPTPQSPVTTDSELSEDEGEGGTPLSPRNLGGSVTQQRKRSESSVDEAVFRDLLSGNKGQRHILTPESQKA